MTKRQNRAKDYQPESMALVARGAKTLARDPMVQQYLMGAVENLGKQFISKLNKPNTKQLMVYNGSNKSTNKGNRSSAPVAYNTRAQNRRARIKGMAGGITIKHREYLGDLMGGDFVVQSYQIQPGLPQSFPWLSGIANNFEKYKIRNLQVHYINVSATSERGRVTMAFDADALDADPVDKVELFSYNGAVEGSVWSPLTLTVPCKPETLFTRQGEVTGTDLKTYDCGRLVLAASNSTADVVVGEIFLSYDIELTIPQPVVCPSAAIDSTSGVSASDMFGTSRTIVGNFPVIVDTNTTTFTAPGNYYLTLTCIGTTPGSITIADGNTQTAVALFTGANSSNNTKSCNVYAIRVGSAGEYITWAISGTVTSTYLFFSMANSTITTP